MARWEERPTNSENLPFFLEARDEDYDIYLFWPSLSNGMESSEMAFAAADHKPLPPLFDHVDYYSSWDTIPPSPLPLTPSSDLRFPSSCELEDQTLGIGLLKVRASGVQEEKESPPRYNNMFRMRLLFMQAARQVDRAVQSVGITLCMNKPRGRTAERAHIFNR